MSSNGPPRDECDSTHFWVYCPGCAYAGKIGVPHNYAADVVVCPQCRQVVSVKPEDRILWQPADPVEFLEKRFPHTNWAGIGSDDDSSPNWQNETSNSTNDLQRHKTGVGQEVESPTSAEPSEEVAQMPAWDTGSEAVVRFCLIAGAVFCIGVAVALSNALH